LERIWKKGVVAWSTHCPGILKEEMRKIVKAARTVDVPAQI
jgi:hypothetical protein